MSDLKILLVAQELKPPWDNGLKVYGKGLMNSLQNIEGANVDAIDSLSGHSGHDLEDRYDFVHVVLTGEAPLRQCLNTFRRATVIKHLVTPSTGVGNAVKTRSYYSLLRTIYNSNRLITSFSSEFVARSYFMKGDIVIPPCVDTSFFGRGEASGKMRREEIYSLLEASKVKFGIDMLPLISAETPLVFYSGPLTDDRFPFRKVLSALQGSKSNLLIIGRPANDGAGLANLNEIVAYANKLGIEKRISVALRTLTEQEKVELLNFADIVIQPFAKLSHLYVAVDPPLFLLEAMSCEKPVITSTSYSFQSFISNGLNGYTVNWDDHLAVNTILDECLNKGTRASLGINARKTVIERFSYESVSHRLLEVYNHEN